ncbi:MAG: NADP-dependent oxidoreductase [Waddliaceae bacterium]
MKAVMFDRFGGIEVAQWREIPAPQPTANEVQMHIAYTAVNPVDWKIREGWLKHMLEHEFPIIPGWDASGTITAMGDDAAKFKIGDEVYAYCRTPVVHWGTYAEYICLPENLVALKPAACSFAKAAAIPLAALTARQALFDAAKLRKGESVLIHGGAGGVGSLAIGFAHHAKATIYTTARKANHDYVKTLGADVAIDYDAEDFVEQIKSREPEGVDVVIDCVGEDTLKQSYAVVKKGGRLVSIVNKIDQEKCKEAGIVGTFVLVEPSGDQLKHIARLIDRGDVAVPHIEEMPISAFAKAWQKSREGHTRGKIALRIGD